MSRKNCRACGRVSPVMAGLGVLMIAACGGTKGRDAPAVPPPSCQGSPEAGSDCGASGETDSSFRVPGGAFDRPYDGISATVSDFRLDAFEVTVGRFRPFVSAVVGGWLPALGSGKHSHLNGGNGLLEAENPSTYETGWDDSWNGSLDTNEIAWNTDLASCAASTWTSSPGSAESLPINCITWFEAYAFCIWDGGFLPSQTEWNYATEGGAEQRVLPWSSPPSDTTYDATYLNYNVSDCCYGLVCGTTGENVLVPCMLGGPTDVGTYPKGIAKWGQLDLFGNVAEWVFDYAGTQPLPSKDGARPSCGQGCEHLLRGGSFKTPFFMLIPLSGDADASGARRDDVGTRCARTP